MIYINRFIYLAKTSILNDIIFNGMTSNLSCPHSVATCIGWVCDWWSEGPGFESCVGCFGMDIYQCCHTALSKAWCYDIYQCCHTALSKAWCYDIHQCCHTALSKAWCYDIYQCCHTALSKAWCYVQNCLWFCEPKRPLGSLSKREGDCPQLQVSVCRRYAHNNDKRRCLI